MANAFVHTELSTDDIGAARTFYGALFGWKLTDLGPEMGNYVMIDVGSKTSGGGIQGKEMPGQPTAWLSYVDVKSVKDTIAKAEQHGAKIVLPYQEIGTMGAIGIFIDPQGAPLGVWQRFPPTKATKPRATKKKAAPKKATKKKAAAKKKRR